MTGAPIDKMALLHDRMPIILPPSAWDLWLDRSEQSTDVIGQLLVPAPSELITFHPVSTAVNTVRNKGPQLIEEIDDAPGQQALL